MSWSFAVPPTDSADFTSAANDAKSVYEHALEGNDYTLDQLASGQADEAIKAAQTVIDSGVLGAGLAGATFSGHAVSEGQPPGNQTLTVTVSISPVEHNEPETGAPAAANPSETQAPESGPGATPTS